MDGQKPRGIVSVADGLSRFKHGMAFHLLKGVIDSRLSFRLDNNPHPLRNIPHPPLTVSQL
jgi:hypothetical protein